MNARAHAATTVQVDEQPHYYDMFYMDVACEVKAHNNRIDSCMGFRGHAFSSGDNCIRVWDMREMQCKHVTTCCKDTSPINVCMEVDAFMYLGSGNGAVRQWSLPFKMKNIEFRGNMWLHNKVINDMCHWRSGETTRLFTVSDDRMCRVWDLTENRCIHVVEPIDREMGTLRSVCCSDRFLFIGSSNGKIYVYLTQMECRRPDRHECSLPTGPTPFCPQYVALWGRVFRLVWFGCFFSYVYWRYPSCCGALPRCFQDNYSAW